MVRITSILLSIVTFMPCVVEAGDSARVAIEFTDGVDSNDAWLEQWQWQPRPLS